MANQKLVQEELDKLQEIQKKNNALIQELGTISLGKINLKDRYEGALKFLTELRESETETAKELETKYGVGSIDLSKGEFIPAPQEAPAAETKTVE